MADELEKLKADLDAKRAAAEVAKTAWFDAYFAEVEAEIYYRAYGILTQAEQETPR
jgi:hypothetical protein